MEACSEHAQGGHACRGVQHPCSQRMKRGLQAPDVVYERLVRTAQQCRHLRAVCGGQPVYGDTHNRSVHMIKRLKQLYTSIGSSDSDAS